MIRVCQTLSMSTIVHMYHADQPQKLRPAGGKLTCYFALCASALLTPVGQSVDAGVFCALTAGRNLQAAKKAALEKNA